jgi:DNA polymerase III alpha subunit
MRLDKFSNPIFNEQDLIDALYHGYKLTSNDVLFVEEKTKDITLLETHSEVTLFDPIHSPTLTLQDLDQAYQESWNMPDEYKSLDIEAWLEEQCPPWDPNHSRFHEELAAYKARNMLDLLRWLKYFVDVCSKNSVVWGLGRGSSVASYILFLIGVHNIDPIKFNLDWREFLR